jgi:2-haloacid dehalogenase
MTAQPTTVVFDLGNVLVGWDPRALYRPLFAGREAEMEWFLTHVCSHEWNLEQDRGRSFAQGVALLTASHDARWHALIRAFHERWPEMLTGEIAGSVALLERLYALGTPLYAVTNWNHETFRYARERYAFLQRFRGIVVSGEEGLIKPERAIYQCLFDRYGLAPDTCVFIDDSRVNVEGAVAAGMHGVHFQNAQQLEAALRGFGFLL